MPICRTCTETRKKSISVFHSCSTVDLVPWFEPGHCYKGPLSSSFPSLISSNQLSKHPWTESKWVGNEAQRYVHIRVEIVCRKTTGYWHWTHSARWPGVTLKAGIDAWLIVSRLSRERVWAWELFIGHGNYPQRSVSTTGKRGFNPHGFDVYTGILHSPVVALSGTD